MSDSATAKFALVVGIGTAALGLVALGQRYSTPRPRLTDVQVASPPALSPPAEEPKPEPTRPRGPSQADRIALLEAAAAGDQAKVEALFAKGVNLDGTLENGAKSGSVALVGWLLDHGVSAKEDEDLTVPPILIADEHDAVVRLLLAKGAHEPTLAKAVRAGAPKAVARLLSAGASAGSKSPEGEPVLMIALRDTEGAKRRLIVEALLKAGADVSTKYEDETPISVMVHNASLGAEDGDKPGDRPLDMVSKLLSRGAKVNGEVLVSALGADEARRAALLDALLGGSLDRAATARAMAFAAERHDLASMKKIGAKGVTWSALEGHTPPLWDAIVASDVAMVRGLLDVGAPMDMMGEDGDTGLLTAITAAAGDSEEAIRVVRLLVERGASANKRGKDGRTPLFVAAQQGNEALVALLVAKGARVDDAVDGMTPYETADARGHDGVMKVLKARGARIRKTSKE